MKINKFTKVLEIGQSIVCIPGNNLARLEDLFPKEISGSSIEKLKDDGTWSTKEVILFENNHFVVSEIFREIEFFQTVRLTLKRAIKLHWELGFSPLNSLIKIDDIFKEGFDVDEALYLAQLSELVYEPQEVIEKTLQENYSFDHTLYYSKQSHKDLQKKGWMKLLMLFFKSKTPLIDLQFSYLTKKDSKGVQNIIVVFRGSQEPQDWMTNFNLKDEGFEGKGRVHQGFHRALKLFFKIVKHQTKLKHNLSLATQQDIDNLNKNSKIILAGHSLGGALATLVGCSLIERGLKKENLEVYTFGAPPVGTKEFSTYYDEKINIYRLVNEQDVVPKLDKMLHLYHLGKEIVLPSNEGEIHSCKGYIDNIIDLGAKNVS
jgi:hypothetical protein